MVCYRKAGKPGRAYSLQLTCFVCELEEVTITVRKYCIYHSSCLSNLCNFCWIWWSQPWCIPCWSGDALTEGERMHQECIAGDRSIKVYRPGFWPQLRCCETREVWSFFVASVFCVLAEINVSVSG